MALLNENVENPDFQHSIKVVARRTGLSPHVIRAWERRYATVRPSRSSGNRRFYTQADIERLTLLRMATEAGHPIGSVAGLDAGRLRTLLAEEKRAEMTGTDGTGPVSASDDLLDEAFRAVAAMDSAGLESVLERALVALGQVRMLDAIVAPLVERIGEEWRAGRLKVAHEHIATAALRTFLGQVCRPISVHPSAGSLLVTTPAGQIHELGAALAAAAAAGHGWRVTYAGAGLPAEEIVSAARACRADAVALSIVHPADDPAIDGELRRLRRLLPKSVAILSGGRAAAAYGPALRDIGAVDVSSMPTFIEALDRIGRQPR